MDDSAARTREQHPPPPELELPHSKRLRYTPGYGDAHPLPTRKRAPVNEDDDNQKPRDLPWTQMFRNLGLFNFLTKKIPSMPAGTPAIDDTDVEMSDAIPSEGSPSTLPSGSGADTNDSGIGGSTSTGSSSPTTRNMASRSPSSTRELNEAASLAEPAQPAQTQPGQTAQPIQPQHNLPPRPVPSPEPTQPAQTQPAQPAPPPAQPAPPPTQPAPPPAQPAPPPAQPAPPPAQPAPPPAQPAPPPAQPAPLPAQPAPPPPPAQPAPPPPPAQPAPAQPIQPQHNLPPQPVPSPEPAQPTQATPQSTHAPRPIPPRRTTRSMNAATALPPPKPITRKRSGFGKSNTLLTVPEDTPGVSNNLSQGKFNFSFPTGVSNKVLGKRKATEAGPRHTDPTNVDEQPEASGSQIPSHESQTEDGASERLGRPSKPRQRPSQAKATKAPPKSKSQSGSVPGPTNASASGAASGTSETRPVESPTPGGSGTNPPTPTATNTTPESSGPTPPESSGPTPANPGPPETSHSTQSTSHQYFDHSPLISILTNNFQALQDSARKDQEKYCLLLQSVRDSQRDVIARLDRATASVPGPSSQSQSSSFQSPPVSSSTIPPPQTPTKKPESRKRPVDELKDDPRKPVFLKCIRCHLQRLLNIDELNKSLRKFAPLTEQELADYESRALGCIAITPLNFRLDMSKSRQHPFNVEAMEVFAENFLQRVAEGWYNDPPLPKCFLEPSYVIGALHEHLKYVFATYKRVTRPDTPQNRKLEDERLERAGRSSRKTLLYSSRLFAVQEDDRLGKHVDWMKRMTSAGISSDESDNEEQGDVFWRVRPWWRSSELELFLWQVDDLITETKAAQIGIRRKARGRKPRVRRFGNKVNTTAVAPPNLPLNCYDPEWLASLRPMQQKLLNAQPRFPFVFPGVEMEVEI